MVRRPGPFLAFLFAAGALAQDAPREYRAAWIATVDNIDWPSRPGLPVAKQQAELDALVECAAGLRLNALVFQVRTACDALYRSELEPWSEWLTGAEGRAPAPLWDPLQHLLERAHARGIEVHAWFNPFRARHAKATSKPAANHVSRTLPRAVGAYGEYLWLDPGDETARAHTAKVVADVLARYDVDGIHIDDYFYPYPEKGAVFADEASHRRYRAGGGKLEPDAWRRANVDLMVAELQRLAHAGPRRVKFGISPFGIARPGLPAGIKAGIDQFRDLHADVRKWWREGWCDYLVPQLYWPIAQKAQSYPVLLAWWAEENRSGRVLLAGNHSNKVPGAWPRDELLEQIARTRAQPGAAGNVFFSMKSLVADAGGLATALRSGPYARPALVPRMPWLDDVPPAAPKVVRTGDRIRIEPPADARWTVVYVRAGDGWRLLRVLPASAREFVADDRGEYTFRVLDAAGNESPPE